ncbi:MAG: AEC family transporter [Thiolinea sp.]
MAVGFTVVFPVFLLLILGNLARRSGFLDEAFWEQAERGTYYVLFPALLVTKLAQADFDWQASGWLVLAALILPFCAALLCFIAQRFLQLAHYDFGAFFQGGIRINNYIGLALVATMPDPALSLLALLMAVVIPLMNVLSVTVLTGYSGAQTNFYAVLTGLAKNPLVLACLVGIALNTLQWLPPVLLLEVLETLGMMALPMGLLAVGAGLRLKTLHQAGRAFAWNTLLKLILVPLLAYILGMLLLQDDLSLAVFVVYAALPTASSAYILTRQMGGNAVLMAGIITGQTLVSMLTLPIVLFLLMPLIGE